jgi:hypothetical protein
VLDLIFVFLLLIVAQVEVASVALHHFYIAVELVAPVDVETSRLHVFES